MQKIIGIVLILIGFVLVFIVKVGPEKETSLLFEYGIWPPLIGALLCLIPGLILYRSNN